MKLAEKHVLCEKKAANRCLVKKDVRLQVQQRNKTKYCDSE